MLEAEPELLQEMSITDRLAVDRLRANAAVQTSSYADRMAIMTDVDDPTARFRKDYKETSFSFAVVKSRNCYDFTVNAYANNRERHLPLTIVKHFIYNNHSTKVIYESICVVFNDTFHDNGFKSAVLDVVAEASEVFHGADRVTVRHNTVSIEGGRVQLPRLLLMPLIQRIVDEHLRFAYSTQLERYIASGFYDGSHCPQLYATTTERPAVTASLCWRDVKNLLYNSQSTSSLTLPEYWALYRAIPDIKYKITAKGSKWIKLEVYPRLFNVHG